MKNKAPRAISRLSLGLLAIALLSTTWTPRAHAAAGTVTFNNNSSCQITIGLAGPPATTNDHVHAALYWAALGSSTFVQRGAAVTVGVMGPGLFAGGTRTTDSATVGGDSAQFQVKAWSGSAATYEQALAGDLIGQSAIFTNLTGRPGNGPFVPPLPPVSIAGPLQGFTLTPKTGATLTVNCPTNKTVICGTSWGFDIPTGSTSCTNTNVSVVITGTVTNNQGCSLQATRSWAITDTCGNSNGCSQTVTVLNTSPPVMTCSTNKTVACGSAWNFDPPSAFDACAGSNLVVNVQSTATNGVCPQLATRTWIASNVCNNASATCTQVVTVVNYNPPVMSCTSNKTVNCASVWSFDLPSAFDACASSNLAVSVQSTITNGVCPQVLTRTWIAYNSCSNASATCTQVVTVISFPEKLVAPNAQAGVEGSSGNSYPFNYNAGTMRYQQVFAASQFAGVPAGGASITAISFRVDQGGLWGAFGPVTLPAIRIDLSTTTIAPDALSTTLTNNVGPDDTVVFNGPLTLSSANIGSPAAFDIIIPLATPFFYNPAAGNLLLDVRNSAGGSSAQFDAVSALGDSVSRVYAFPVTASTGGSDSTGLIAQFTFGTSPLYLLCSNLTVTCGSPIPTNPPAWTDSCCSNVTVVLLGSTNTSSGCTQTISQVWQAVDCCSNSTTCTQVVTVLPSVPVLLCSNVTITCGSPIPTNPPAYTDACCSNVTVTLTGSSTNLGCPPTIYQTWQALDLCCGTSNSCTRSITILDSTPPVITCSSNKTVAAGSGWTFDPPSAYDSCCGTNLTVLLISSNATVISECQTNWMGIWQATDCCTNISTCTQTVTVLPPVVLQPKIWVGGLSGSWGDPLNWIPQAPPAPGDSIYITNSSCTTVTVDSFTSPCALGVSNLTVGLPGGVCSNALILASGPTNQPLHVLNNFTVQGGGMFDATGSQLQVGGLTTVGASGVATFVLNSGLAQSGAFALGSTSNSLGQLNLDGGTLILSGNLTMGAGSTTSTGLVTITSGSLVVTGGVVQVGTAANGRLTISGGNHIFRQLNLNHHGTNGSGSFYGLGGHLQILEALRPNFSVANGIDIDGSGGSIIIGDGLDAALLVGAGDVTNFSNMTVGYNLTPTYTGTYTQTGGVTQVTNNLVVGDCTSGVRGVVNLSGGVTYVTNDMGTGILTLQKGTVTMDIGSTLFVDTLDLSNPCAQGQFIYNGGTIHYKNLLLPDPPPPLRLTIRLSGPNLIISWPSVYVGYTLKQSQNVPSSGWNPVQGTTTDDRTTRSITIQPTPGRMFYRLFKP
jgi:hypothetical protein